MSIIFEGVDGTGKTTTANDILKFYGDYFYIHNWSKPKNEIDISSEITKEFILLQSPTRLLFDRSFIISEYVYSNILGRKSIITFEHIQAFEVIVNQYKHAVQLFIFEDIKKLNFKKEDKNLPFAELNALYIKLFTEQIKINNFILNIIDYMR